MKENRKELNDVIIYKGIRRKFYHILGIITLIVLCIIFFLPLYWMICTALKESAYSFMTPPQWFPDPLTWDNFRQVFERMDFMKYVKNTLITSVVPIIGTLFSCPMVAYSLTKIPWKGGRYLFPVILATMMIPSQAIIIANYLTIADWGIRNTYAALILPNAAAAFAVFNMRQAFLTLPKEIHEAAEIDGCTNFKFLYTIGVPLIKPSLGALIIYVFLQSWNYYLWPLLVTDSVNMRTVQIGLGMLQGAEATDFRPVMAGAMVILIPSILVFIIGQKQMISGLTAGAVKG